MKNLYWIVFTKYNRVLTYLTICVFALVLVVGAFLSIKVALLEPTSAVLSRTLKLQRQDLAIAERNKEDLKATSPGTKRIGGRQVVDTLQEEVESKAVESHCRVEQFTAPPTPSQYTPHYGSDSGGYQSYHIRMMLSGNLGRIFTLLQSLSDSEVPFEFTSLSFAPSASLTDTTSNSASATVEMDVLAKGGTT